MKKIIFITLLISTLSFSQLYVSPSSYMFCKNNLLYVQQNVNLDAGANLYLRNDSQLLQGTTSTSTNSGAGTLSVFQEGTVNNFAYNYWCSPVGSATGSPNGTFGISMLGQPTSNIATTPATVLPTSNSNGTSTPLAISSRWIYRFLASTTYSQWSPVFGASNLIQAGQGFTMKGTSGTDATNVGETVVNNPGSAQRYDFRGRPNDGNIDIVLGASPNYTLTGNPYPSAIDLKLFLTSAPGISNSNGIAYFWEHDKASAVNHLLITNKGGYGAYSTTGANGTYVPATFNAYDGSGNQISTGPSSGIAYQRRFTPVGQGFMLQGSGAGGTVTMTNAFRVFVKEGSANFSNFERNSTSNTASSGGYLPFIPSVSGYDYTQVSTQETPQIRFKTILNNVGIRITSLAFDEAATDGVDFSMDANSPGGSPVDGYFVLNNKEYVISSINFDVNKRIPVGFKSDVVATIKFKVDEFVNFSGADAVYLYDKTTDIYHDVKNNAYEFSIPVGATNSRYEITFRNATKPDAIASTTDFLVNQNNIKQVLVISNLNNLNIKSVSLFDVSGKLILNKTGMGTNSSFEISTHSVSEGVYIVKIDASTNDNFGQKIIIKK